MVKISLFKLIRLWIEKVIHQAEQENLLFIPLIVIVTSNYLFILFEHTLNQFSLRECVCHSINCGMQLMIHQSNDGNMSFIFHV